MSTPFDDHLQAKLKKVQEARDKLTKGEPPNLEAPEVNPFFHDVYLNDDNA